MSSEAGVRDFAVPDLGEGLEDATVVEWHVEPGERVELNQPLCSVETAKAVVEVPSPYAGVIVERHGEVGETLAVGSLLVRIDVGGAGGAAAAAGGTAAAAGDTGGTGDAGEPTAEAAPKRRAVLVGYGVEEEQDASRRTRRAAQAAPPAPGRPARARPARGASQSTSPLAKPPVRLLARRLGVDLAALAPGSGASGIVTREDVLAAATAEGAPEHAAGAARDGATGDIELRPVQGIRARIAERMVQSRATIPDATCAVEVDCSRLLDLRAALRRSSLTHTDAVTPFSLICRLLLAVLRRHPLLNASFETQGPAIRVQRAVHLGVATATERGLLVPVVRDAQELNAVTLARAIAEAAEGARAGTLPPARLQGSTLTVSNYGALGLDDGVPVINPPEAAILGVGAIKPRPWVVDGELAVRPTARLVCAFDHRICDGADAGAFMSELRELIEAPELSLLYA